MKTVLFIMTAVILTGCAVTENGIVVDLPNTPQISICQNVATDADVATMKEKIDKEAFPSDKLNRARFVTKEYCFTTDQIISIMDSFAFEDDKLDIAKDLYDQCTNKDDYDLVADEFVHNSNKEELMEFISQNP